MLQSADLLAVHPERTAHHWARRLVPTGTLPRLGCRNGGRCRLVGVGGLLPRCRLVGVGDLLPGCRLVGVGGLLPGCRLVGVGGLLLLSSGRCRGLLPLGRVACCLIVVWSETSAVVISAGAAGMLSSGGKPMRAAALLIPSPIALTRSPATVAGLSGGISRAGVGSHGGMLRS